MLFKEENNILGKARVCRILKKEMGLVICCGCSVAHLLSCVWLCDPMDCSPPGFTVLHYLPEIAQTHVHWVDDAIETSHPLSPPSLPAFSLSKHLVLFQSQLFASGSQSSGVSAPMNILGWFPLGLTGLISLLSKGLSRVLSSTTVWKHQPIF